MGGYIAAGSVSGTIATAVIIILLIVIAVFSIRSYSKKLKSGCCGAGGDEEKKVRVSDKDPSHYPFRAKIGVEGMTCNHCKQRVENALNAEEGVWAQVDLEKKSADIRMKTELSEQFLRRIIMKSGYTMTDYKKQSV